MESQPEQIDLNQANIDQLAQLPGFGPTLAERIIDHRQRNGPFTSVEELADIHGISEAMVQDVVDTITVGGVVAHESPEDRLNDDVTLPPEEERPAQDGSEGDDEEAIAALENEIRFLTEDETTSTVGSGIIDSDASDIVQEDPSEEEAEASQESDLSGGPPPSKYQEVIRSQSQPVPDLVAEGPATDVRAQPRGCSIQAAIFGTFFGALLGALLVLIILFLLNGGTLQFSSERESGQFKDEIQSQLDIQSGEQGDMMSQVEDLDDLFNQVVEDVSVIATQQAEVLTAFEETGGVVAGFEREVATLEARIADIFIAADDFNAFLDGLGQLMLEIEDTAVDAQATTGDELPVTSQASSPTTEAEVKPISTPTPRPATRTPRPTFTPIITVSPSPSVTPRATGTP